MRIVIWTLIGAILGISLWVVVFDNNSDTNTNSNQTAEDRTTYTHEEYGLSYSYPNSWPDETRSNDTVTYTDTISQQEITSPLIALSVWQYDETVTEYQKWVAEHSASEDEQTRERSDIEGFYGIQQWVWHQRNPRDSSSWSYYMFLPNRVIELRAQTDLDDPSSEQFEAVQSQVKQIFDSVSITI